MTSAGVVFSRTGDRGALGNVLFDQNKFVDCASAFELAKRASRRYYEHKNAFTCASLGKPGIAPGVCVAIAPHALAKRRMSVSVAA